ncbi:sortase domain-bontaining protein [Streptomyces sp. NBC_01190]|uniref:sortase domain-containing protein n=1 Tax=Streptomyces sp. NBC_01190 TaxID=2903767 RepID=UPI003869C074|nr:sortase [Streptomyces sp. NBC_01190]
MNRTRAAVLPALACSLVVLVGGLAGGAAASTAGPSGRAPAVAGATMTAADRPARRATDPRDLNASLTIASIGIRALRVVPYQGTTDDWPGTRIQDRGIAASPHGGQGGVGPGEIGNYLVTGHRVAAGGPLGRVPSLKKGQRVLITAGGTVYEYKITETRITSFRSARSLTEQRAAVPGFPGKRPTRAMITVSTCATPEDDAAGNFWRDDKGNPEHRIDKIGVLVSTHRSTAGPSTP